MPNRTIVAAVLSALAASAGVLEIEEKKFPVAHVYARKGPGTFDSKQESLFLLVSDRELKPEVRLDPDQIREMNWNGEKGLLQLEISDNSLFYTIRSKEGGTTSASRSPVPFAVEVTGERVKGKILLDQRDSTQVKHYVEAEFDTQIERAPVEPAPTAADAEAAKKSKAAQVYLAFQAALAKGDKAAMMRMLDPEKAAMMNTPDFPKMLEMVQSLQAKNIQVLKVTERANGMAELSATGDGGKQTGKVRMAQVDGQWRVMRESWEQSK
ncbi:MAG: hypothetical protein U0Q16_20375 [Bryobacteraceae bacterium]